jgi:hypothetical protein
MKDFSSVQASRSLSFKLMKSLAEALAADVKNGVENIFAGMVSGPKPEQENPMGVAKVMLSKNPIAGAAEGEMMKVKPIKPVVDIPVQKMTSAQAVQLVKNFWGNADPRGILESHHFVGKQAGATLYELSWAHMSCTPSTVAADPINSPLWEEASDEERDLVDSVTDCKQVLAAMVDTQCRGGPHFRDKITAVMHQIPYALQNIVHGVICHRGLVKISKVQQVQVLDMTSVSKPHCIEGFTGSMSDANPRMVRPRLLIRSVDGTRTIAIQPCLYLIRKWQGPDLGIGPAEACKLGLQFSNPYTMMFKELGCEISTVIPRGIQ